MRLSENLPTSSPLAAARPARRRIGPPAGRADPGAAAADLHHGRGLGLNEARRAAGCEEGGAGGEEGEEGQAEGAGRRLSDL
jgi:hypothetical protein